MEVDKKSDSKDTLETSQTLKRKGSSIAKCIISCIKIYRLFCKKKDKSEKDNKDKGTSI